MIQKPMQCFESKCGMSKIFVENEMPIGIFHDFLMEIKGLMVDRMVMAHKEQLQVMEAQKSLDTCETFDCA